MSIFDWRINRHPLRNDIDNCLICPHAIIKENELAKMAKAYGWMQLAKRFDFPVVICGKEPGGKYVANPTARPGWCKRK
jgi:hypothetical protein